MILFCPVLLAMAVSVQAPEAPSISWKRLVVDRQFRSEGVAVADLDRDGHLDIAVGELWYQGPDFKIAHELQKPGDYGDGMRNYSRVFAVFPGDFNADGWVDLIIIDFPGKPCYWLENPAQRPGLATEPPGHSTERPALSALPSGYSAQRPGVPAHAEAGGTGSPPDREISPQRPGISAQRSGDTAKRPGLSIEPPEVSTERPRDSAQRPGYWRKHFIWHSACNETPLFKDLLGTGRPVLIMGFQPKGRDIDANEGQLAYFCPHPTDPYRPWRMFPISEAGSVDRPIPGTHRFSHGLGVGDLNGDGRLDVLTSGTNSGGVGGWWEQPEKPDGLTPWKFHPYHFGEACADMFAGDLTGDGKAEILCTSAHRFGIWQLNHRPLANNQSHFEAQDLFPGLVSETHAAHFEDLDGDGLKDLITGKRFWSHGRHEPGADMPAMLYWFQASRRPDGAISFQPRVIDTDSGVGTQFSVVDLNGDGLLDVVTSNKKGVYCFLQTRK